MRRLGWRITEKAPIEAGRLMALLADRLFAQGKGDLRALARIDAALTAALAALPGTLSSLFPPPELIQHARATMGPGPASAMLDRLAARWRQDQERERERVDEALRRLPEPLPRDLDDSMFLDRLFAQLAEPKGEAQWRGMVDVALGWPTDRVAPLLPQVCRWPWPQERAALVLTLRFGRSWGWTDWRSWLATVGGRVERALAQCRELCRERAVELLLLWELSLDSPDPDLVAHLEEWCGRHGGAVDGEGFSRRWGGTPPPLPASVLTGAATPAAQTGKAPPLPSSAEPATVPAIAPARAAPVAPARAAPVVPAAPKAPSLWHDYIQSFLVENWSLVIGLLMVVAGSSLLAYFTWDKHWLLRYTIMPALLAGFTASLAGIGSWLEKTDPRFKGTAALLRGAAIGLLPVNFMAVALLSEDPAVTQKLVVVPAMSVLYLAAFGWGLRAWCQRVHRALGSVLAGTLLLLNALVVLGPVARAVVSVREDALHVVLGSGFYLGFLAVVAAIRHFDRHVLGGEEAADRRVPWFVGATLAVTYIQVFAWVHTLLRRLPEPHAYAPLVILAGGLVLAVERRFLELRSERDRHVGESFLGFAFVILGLLMAVGQPQIRVVAFVLAGLVWLAQAVRRDEALHHVIGLVLLCLAGASVGLLDGFDGKWLPAIGVALAGALGLTEAWSERSSRRLLAEASAAVQQVVLLLTTFVAAVTQWQLRSTPLLTAAWLLMVAAFFASRARAGRSLRALITNMVVLAAALPYLGCVDVLGRTLHGNTMVFGLAVLAILWLAFTMKSRDGLIVSARSTVLWFYGSLAVAAMVLRVVIETERPLDVLWHRTAMDLAGPLLMTAVLVVTAYLSRSLVPAWMAAVILVVLFPELRAHLRVAFPGLTWGSGLGSAAFAFALALLSFRLREWPLLRGLGEGDRVLGREPFPWRRFDATLFTIPAVASAAFLCAKVDVWNFARNLTDDGLGPKTAAALGLVGVTWTALAVFLRREPFAVGAVHLGWISAFLGIHYGRAHLPGPQGLQWTFVATVVLLQALELSYRRWARGRPWVDDLLRATMTSVLQAGSLLLAAAVVAALVQGFALDRALALGVVVGLELLARALVTRDRLYGASLFVLAWTELLAWTAPGPGPLAGRLSVAHGLSPTLWMCAAVQLVHVLLERRADLVERLRALLWPAQVGTTLLAAFLGIVGLADGVVARSTSLPQRELLLGVVALTARAHGSGFFALLASLLLYVLAHEGRLRLEPSAEARLSLLFTPWRSGLLALGLALAGAAGRWLHRRLPLWLVSPLGLSALRWPATPWMFAPAAALAVFGSLAQTVSPTFREQPVQLWASYLGAVALALIAWSWQRPAHFAVGGLLLTLANVHAVRVFLGAPLRTRGLSEDHLVSLGLGLTLLQGTLLRLLARSSRVSAAINTASLPIATLILVFLCTNYLSQPNLEAVPPFRFMVSGAMALLAGWYFRQAALKPGPGEERHVEVCIGLYHFGVTIAIWCAALLLPWLRRPATALIALGLPVFYFYVRAEIASRSGEDVTLRRYHASAALVGFFLLGLYVFRAAFQMVLFPETPIHTEHYHQNAPYLMLLALVLLRLHGLGGTGWLAFYGGLALLTGSYFTLTMPASLSPFQRPVAGAWCALGVAHFWTVASYQRSPLRSAVQVMAGIETPQWIALRRSWGRCVLAAIHVAVVLALFDPATDTRLAAPLILGAASIVAHQGILRESGLYMAVAALEVALAVHAGFVVPSYLAAEHVIWVVLASWAVVLGARRFFETWAMLSRPGPVMVLLAALSLAHVFDHHPSSTAGLWGAVLITILGLLSPCGGWNPQSAEQRLLAGLPLLAPAWLVFSTQAPLLEEGLQGARHAWPVLATATALLATGWAARRYQEEGFPSWEAPTSRSVRLFDQTLVVMGANGQGLLLASLVVSFLVALAVQVTHYDDPFAAGDLVLFCGLYVAFVVSWFAEGQKRQSLFANSLAQLSVVGLFALVRRQLALTTDFWTPEYDVWASLLVSIGLTGAKPWLDGQPREMRLPSMVSLFTLPAAALLWTLFNHLGSDTVLVVIAVHSVCFAYLGMEERDSPYNLVAVSGFVAFVMLVFWSKLELRVLHAYAIPTGLGILVLVQLFGHRMEPETRNRVRAVALLGMLGSAAYYALVDERYAVTFNVTLLLLCLGAMALGSFLRIRLYLTLGSAGVVVDLASIIFKALRHMDRGPRMTAVGLLVLLIGAALVAGAVYYQTHREALGQRIDQWRRRLGEWE